METSRWKENMSAHISIAQLHVLLADVALLCASAAADLMAGQLRECHVVRAERAQSSTQWAISHLLRDVGVSKYCQQARVKPFHT